jgi:hypothetical protein
VAVIESADGRVEAVEVRGLDVARVERMRGAARHDWQGVFAVYVNQDDMPQPSLPPAVLGEYVVGETSVRFEPRFPFSSGLTYTARFNVSRFHGEDTAVPYVVAKTFTMPTAEVEGTTVVTAVYPSADAWPENTLRLYVHFSNTMKQGSAIHHVRLVDNATGETVEQAFVETQPELWDPGRRRLTLFFHPGRVKRGLQMNERLGPPLEAGRSYTIVVDAAMLDANGQPLAEVFHKSIVASAADRQGPDPKRWRIAAPDATTRAPLQVTIDEPVDRALLGRFLEVWGPADHPIPGRVVVSDGERRWEFVPDSPWSTGRYQLLVNRRIEDLAGNTPDRPFDYDANEERDPDEEAADPHVRLGFEVR